MKADGIIKKASVAFNWLSSLALLILMLLTVTDVLLRIFSKSVPGTYEIAGLLGGIIISFSLAYTSVEKGHIAVEFLVNKMPERVQFVISRINLLAASLFFSMISIQSFKYAMELRSSGEVSATIQMPTYPFVIGLCAGLLSLAVVLMSDFIYGFIERKA